MQILFKLNNYLTWISEKVLIVCLGANVIIVFWSVLCRNILNIGQVWVEEVAIGLMIWSVFLGCSVAIKRSAHIRSEIIQQRIPLVYKRWVMIFIYIAILFFLFVIVKYGYDMVYLLRQARSHSLRIKTYWFNSSILIGFGFSFSQTLELLLLELKGAISERLIRRKK